MPTLAYVESPPPNTPSHARTDLNGRHVGAVESKTVARIERDGHGLTSGRDDGGVVVKGGDDLDTEAAVRAVEELALPGGG